MLLLCERVLVLIYHVTFSKMMRGSWLYNGFSHKVVFKQKAKDDFTLHCPQASNAPAVFRP